MSFKGILRLWLAIPVAIVLFSSCQKGAVPSLENERMSITFNAATGWPVSMKDKAFNEEMLDASVPLWELRDARDSVIKEAAAFLRCRRKPEGLQLRWCIRLSTKNGRRSSARMAAKRSFPIATTCSSEWNRHATSA